MNNRFGSDRGRQGEAGQWRGERSGGGREREDERSGWSRQSDDERSGYAGGRSEVRQGSGREEQWRSREPQYSSDYDETYGSEWERGREGEARGDRDGGGSAGQRGWYSQGSAGTYGGGSGGGYSGGRGGSGYGGSTGTDYGGGGYGGYAGNQARFGGSQGGSGGLQGRSYGAGNYGSSNEHQGSRGFGGGYDQGYRGPDLASPSTSQRSKLSGGFAGRGPKGYTRTDERIREDVCDRLSLDDDVDASEIEVRVQNGEVTLEGSVATRGMKHRAEDIAEEVNGVSDVHNQLRVLKSMMNELKDKVTGKEGEQHYAGSGTKNSPANTSLGHAGKNGTL